MEAGSGVTDSGAVYLDGWGEDLVGCLLANTTLTLAEAQSVENHRFGVVWASSLFQALSAEQQNVTYYSLGFAFGAAFTITLAIAIQKRAMERTFAKTPRSRSKCACPSALWAFGLVLHLIGGLLEVCALALAPQQLVTAIGASGLLLGLFLAACMHRSGPSCRRSCGSADFWLVFLATWCTLGGAAGIVMSVADVALVNLWSRAWTRDAVLVAKRWQQLDPWPAMIPILVITGLANVGCMVYDLKLQKARHLQRRIARAPRARKVSLVSVRQAEVTAALGSISRCSIRLVRFLYPLAAGLNAAWCVFFSSMCAKLAYPTIHDPWVMANATEYQTYLYRAAGLALLPLQLLWLTRALVYFDAWYVLPAFYIPLLAASTTISSVFYDDLTCIDFYSERAGIGGGGLALLLIAEVFLFCVSTSKRQTSIITPGPAPQGKAAAVVTPPLAESGVMDGGTAHIHELTDFDRADVDGSGYLDQAEFAAVFDERGAARDSAYYTRPDPVPRERELPPMVPFASDHMPPPMEPVPPRPGRGPALPPIGGRAAPEAAPGSHDAMVAQQVERQSVMLDRVARDVAALRAEKMYELQAGYYNGGRSVSAPSSLPPVQPAGAPTHHVVPAPGYTMQANAAGGALELQAGQVVMIGDQPYMLVDENRERIAEL